MEFQVTYSEEELSKIFHASKRKVQEYRKLGLLKGTKITQGYVYHNDEITEFFKKFKGKDISNLEQLKKSTLS